MLTNQESTRRQYQLAERARQLGWPAPQIEIIDEDLGLSGADSQARTGFQRLVAAIGLGKIGLVLVTEVWRDADSARVRHILQNPAYAGAYVYGRRQADPVRRRSGARSATTKVALGEWAVCLPAAHPGYISWEAFMANQRRLADNINHYAAGHAGAPRRGSALLQGIAVCGRCGRRMSLRYTGM